MLRDKQRDTDFPKTMMDKTLYAFLSSILAYILYETIHGVLLPVYETPMEVAVPVPVAVPSFQKLATDPVEVVPFVERPLRVSSYDPCEPHQIHLSLGDEHKDDDDGCNTTGIMLSFSIRSIERQCDPDRISVRIYYWSELEEEQEEKKALYDTVVAAHVDHTNTTVNRYNFTNPKTGQTYSSDWLYHVPLTGLQETTTYLYRIHIRRREEEEDQSSSSFYGTVIDGSTNTYARRAATTTEVTIQDDFCTKAMDVVGCSDTLSFVTASISCSTAQPPGPTKFLIVGDLGQSPNSTMTVQNMIHQTKKQNRSETTTTTTTTWTPATLVMIAGDLSYADSEQVRWDSWLELMEPLVSRTPMVAAVGNHEIEWDKTTHLPFLAYENRFRWPNRIADAVIGPVHESFFFDSSSSLSSSSTVWGEKSYYDYVYGNAFYSFTYGLTKVIVLSSYSDTSIGSVQYQWLVEELENVDRVTTPWLVVMLHTQFYTTFLGHNNEGITTTMRESMEPLFVKYRVNVIYCGHDHAYMRSKSMANGMVDTEGKSPVYMIVGEGGNREGHSEFLNQEAEEWVAVRDNKVYGFGTLEIVNASHAFWRWIANGEDDGFSDEYWFRNHYYEDLVGEE